MNGCICCTVRGDLVESLKKIWKKTGDALDGIIIETTGLADPAPVCQTFFIEEEIRKHYEIDAVLTVVDAKHILQHLREEKPKDVENEAVEQILFADKILLNKTDLVDEEKLSEITNEINGLNKWAKVIRTQLSVNAPNMDEILSLGAFDLNRVENMDPSFLDGDEEHIHDESVTSIGFTLKPNEQINRNALEHWISVLIGQFNNDLFRYKGVIAVKGMDQKFIFQGVHMLFGGDYAGDWGDQERNSCFCFIGRNLDKMGIEEGFKSCIATESLRFKVGDRVKANVGSWKAGKIIALWDDGNPYRIGLNDGTNVWGPMDDDRFVVADVWGPEDIVMGEN